jgi:hypothetical protein
MSRSNRSSIDRTGTAHAFRLDDEDFFDLPLDGDEPVPVDRCFDDASRGSR